MSKHWTAYARRTAILERQYTPKIRKAITDLYSSFTSDLKQYGEQQARNNLNQTAISEDLLTTLNAIYNRAGLMGAKLTYSELKASLKTEQKAGGFGRNNRWIQGVMGYLRTNLYNLAAKILNTTKEDILNLLEEGISGNLSIDQIVQLFRSSTRPESRTRLIVRTEINRAANVGHQIGAQDFPYEVNKKWIAARDHRTRHSHNLVHNHVVSENGVFEVPVYQGLKPTGQVDRMNAPGDPNAHVSNVANCRCRIVYEAVRDQQGQLIPRSASQAPVIPIRATSARDITPSIAAQAKALSDAVHVGVK